MHVAADRRLSVGGFVVVSVGGRGVGVSRACHKGVPVLLVGMLPLLHGHVVPLYVAWTRHAGVHPSSRNAGVHPSRMPVVSSMDAPAA